MAERSQLKWGPNYKVVYSLLICFIICLEMFLYLSIHNRPLVATNFREEVEEFFASMDRDFDGRLSFEEFMGEVTQIQWKCQNK